MCTITPALHLTPPSVVLSLYSHSLVLMTRSGVSRSVRFAKEKEGANTKREKVRESEEREKESEEECRNQKRSVITRLECRWWWWEWWWAVTLVTAHRWSDKNPPPFPPFPSPSLHFPPCSPINSPSLSGLRFSLHPSIYLSLSPPPPPLAVCLSSHTHSFGSLRGTTRLG